MTASCLPVYKPRGLRSTELVGLVKKTLQLKKVGHTGTLDSFAEGLIILLIGSATALSHMCMTQRKSYRASITFGATTDTLDPLGKKTYSDVYPMVHQIIHAMDAEQGSCVQQTPQFSAIKIGGKRCSDLVRAGISVTPPERRIQIYAATLIHAQRSCAEIALTVSKGTYIRAYAQTLANHWGGLAYLSALSRESIGGLHCSEAYTLEDIQKSAGHPEKLLKPLSWLLGRITVPHLALTEEGKQVIATRKMLRFKHLPNLSEFARDVELNAEAGQSHPTEYIACSDDHSVSAIIRIHNRSIRYHQLDTPHPMQ